MRFLDRYCIILLFWLFTFVHHTGVRFGYTNEVKDDMLAPGDVSNTTAGVATSAIFSSLGALGPGPCGGPLKLAAN